MRYVRYAVEGPTDEPVAETLLKSAGLIPRHTLTTYGKDYLDRKLPGLNRTASTLAWFVIRDLDHDDNHLCIRALRSNLMKGQTRGGMCFRLAVRAHRSLVAG